MTKSAMIHSRQTSEFKEKAEAILREVGIPLPSAYELFYRQIIAYHGLPFDDRIPTQETIQVLLSNHCPLISEITNSRGNGAIFGNVISNQTCCSSTPLLNVS
jgi:addiction module RelB/DinJ family antitoxin